MNSDILDKLITKFGLSFANNMSESHKKRIVINKLIDCRIAKETGKYTVTTAWEIPEAKLRSVLAQNGIMIEPEVVIDDEKLNNCIGETSILDDKLLIYKDLYEKILIYDRDATKSKVKDFCKKHGCNFESEQQAVKMWLSQ